MCVDEVLKESSPKQDKENLKSLRIVMFTYWDL
jgi:hypothetical protein